MAKMPIWLKRTEIWNKNFYACSSVRPVVQTKFIQPFQKWTEIDNYDYSIQQWQKMKLFSHFAKPNWISQLHMQLSYASFPNKKENGKNRFLALQGVINK